MKRIKNILEYINILIFGLITVEGSISIINMLISRDFLKIIVNVPWWTIIVGGLLGLFSGCLWLSSCVKQSISSYHKIKDYKNQYEGDEIK